MLRPRVAPAFMLLTLVGASGIAAQSEPSAEAETQPTATRPLSLADGRVELDVPVHWRERAHKLKKKFELYLFEAATYAEGDNEVPSMVKVRTMRTPASVQLSDLTTVSQDCPFSECMVMKDFAIDETWRGVMAHGGVAMIFQTLGLKDRTAVSFIMTIPILPEESGHDTSPLLDEYNLVAESLRYVEAE